LLRPDPTQPNAVDLARAIATVCGVEGFDEPGTSALAAKIGEAEHLVFVLIDGLGLAEVEAMSSDRFLPRHVAGELRSVFPSATASAITSLATGCWPATHAVPGWWTFFAEHDLSATPLPFCERFSRQPLAERGVTTDVFPQPAMLSRFTRDARSFKPAAIANSTYSRYFRGGTPADGYEELSAGVDAVLARVKAASAPTYSYLYISTLDHLSHDYGPDSDEARAHLLELDGEVERLATGLAGRARLVLSADHGQVRVAEEQKHKLLGPADELVKLLRVPPTGEPRAPLFHVRDGAHDAFRAAFAERLGDAFVLVSIDEVEALELYGPGPLHPLARARLGDYLALSAGCDVLLYRPGDAVTSTEKLRGYHGGLTSDEVQIPLVVV
jgi:hypothetical protein